MLKGYWRRSAEIEDSETERSIGRSPDISGNGVGEDIETGIREALMKIDEPLYIIENRGSLESVTGGSVSIDWRAGGERESSGKEMGRDRHREDGYFPIRAYAPPLPLENLGDREFRARHNLRYPYIAGAMANGITSVEMVEAMAANGMMAFFGAGGVSPTDVESAVIRMKSSIGPAGMSGVDSEGPASLSAPSWGCNFIHAHGDPELEMAIAELYLRHGVSRVSAAAFMRITLPLVYYRIKGIHRDMEGNVVAPNHVIAKVSRVEVARQFFSPPPEKLVVELLRRKMISQEEAELSSYIPMAQDLTAEADSGGHTDNRPAISLWPTMVALKNEFNVKFRYRRPLCVGFAGGISTPESAAAAFQMGAAYILTGSVNQSCVEAGTSEGVKELLSQAEQADVAMAPAADMFEIGARVQVLKRGTMFPVRAEKLYHTYRNYEKFSDVPEKLRSEIEEKFLQSGFEQKWNETKEFFRIRNPREIERAEQDERYRMALVFRSYLGLSSRWSINGDPSRRMDYQIWCGPAIGAFNQWVKGSFMEKSQNRKTPEVALNLLLGASISTRAVWIRSQGVDLPGNAASFEPLPIERLKEIIQIRS